MSDKHKSAKYSPSRTDTLIGVGTRIEGNITFTGVLRTDGEIIGDVSCDDDTRGTIVVGKLGRVTGTIKAPHIVVVGRVDGPAHSSESIEIQAGACVMGGASYRDIVIHEGGVVEGVMTPVVPTVEDRSGQDQGVQRLALSAVKESDGPPADTMADGNEIGKRPGKGRKLGVAIVLLIAVLAIVWMTLSPTALTPPVAAVVIKPTPAATENLAPPSLPAASATPLDISKAVVTSALPLVPSSETVTKDAVQAAPPENPERDLKQVVVVQGDSPGKPADFLYVVVGKESAVLFRKQRKDPAEGTRLDLAHGASKRIPIAKDDMLRVEQGRGLQMFYQGRKVPSGTIASGAWISFVPNSRSGASDK